jgi:hypothetical protein
VSGASRESTGRVSEGMRLGTYRPCGHSHLQPLPALLDQVAGCPAQERFLLGVQALAPTGALLKLCTTIQASAHPLRDPGGAGRPQRACRAWLRINTPLLHVLRRGEG